MLHINKSIKTLTADDLIFSFVALTFFLLPAGTSPPLIAIGLAAIFWLLSNQFTFVTTVIRKKWFIPVIGIVLLPWIGLLYSKNMSLGLDYALKGKYWLVLFITAGLVLTEKRVTLMINFLWAGLLIGVFLALVQFLGFMKPLREGFLGFGGVHTLVSMYLIIGILMAGFYFKTAGTWEKKIGYFLLIPAFLFHLTVLEGRNGYLVFALLSPLVANNIMHRFSLATKSIVILLLVLSMALSPVVQNEVNKTITQLKEKQIILKGEFHPRFDRPFMFHTAAGLIRENPFIGTGTGSYRYYTEKLGHPSAHPHSNILYMGVSFGLIGIFVYLALFGIMFKKAMKNRQTPLGYFVLSICLTLFFGGFLNTQILNTSTLLFLTMGYGLLNHLE